VKHSLAVPRQTYRTVVNGSENAKKIDYDRFVNIRFDADKSFIFRFSFLTAFRTPRLPDHFG